MPIKFVLLVNKQGQTRLAKYTDQSMSVEERRALEGEIVRKCLTRAEKQVEARALSLLPALPSVSQHSLTLAFNTVLVRGTPELQGRLPAIRLPLFPGGHRWRGGKL